MAVGLRSRGWVCGSVAALLVALACAPAAAQNDQFGGESRAAAATKMTILAVQQGISSLPPTSGQSFTYEFDPEIHTSVRSEQLGATSFRSTQTVGDGKLSLRGAVSFFELSNTFGPIDYLVELDDTDAGVTGFGLHASAKVTLLNFAANYGITDRFELMLNLPVVLTRTKASQVFATTAGTVGADPPVVAAVTQGAPLSDDPETRAIEIDELQGQFDEFLSDDCELGDDCLVFDRDSLDEVGFNEGSHSGVGRISIGAKYLFLDTEMADMAFSTELFFPSPSEEEFAGSESGAILPRLIAYFPFSKHFRLHADAGYDLDFDESELRRFVWNLGASVPVSRFTFDAGFGGSLFDTPIRWTPDETTGSGPLGTATLTALGDNTLGDDYVDALVGMKARLTDSMVISGAITADLTDQGFRSEVVGTGAFEVYF